MGVVGSGGKPGAHLPVLDTYSPTPTTELLTCPSFSVQFLQFWPCFVEKVLLLNTKPSMIWATVAKRLRDEPRKTIPEARWATPSHGGGLGVVWDRAVVLPGHGNLEQVREDGRVGRG